jgi:hypothetical protein
MRGIEVFFLIIISHLLLELQPLRFDLFYLIGVYLALKLQLAFLLAEGLV